MPTTRPTGTYGVFESGFFGSSNAASATVHHEDLTDVVTILDSSQTPLFSTAPKVRARDVVHSWATDTLAATAISGATAGGDFSGDTLTTPRRLFNGTHIFRGDVVVSDREREANSAGIRDMYNHQIMKTFKVLARNAESRLWSSAASATGAAAVSPRMWGIPGFSITTAGASASGIFTGDIVGLSQTMFQNGAEPDSIWFAPAHKRRFVDAVITAGTALNTRNIAANDQRINANVDVFLSPFNQLYAVMTDRFIPQATATGTNYPAYYIGDRSMAKVAFYRTPRHVPMGKSGDHTRGMVLMELTLQLQHPSSWGAVTGVTAT